MSARLRPWWSRGASAFSRVKPDSTSSRRRAAAAPSVTGRHSASPPARWWAAASRPPVCQNTTGPLRRRVEQAEQHGQGLGRVDGVEHQPLGAEGDPGRRLAVGRRQAEAGAPGVDQLQAPVGRRGDAQQLGALGGQHLHLGGDLVRRAGSPTRPPPATAARTATAPRARPAPAPPEPVAMTTMSGSMPASSSWAASSSTASTMPTVPSAGGAAPGHGVRPPPAGLERVGHLGHPGVDRRAVGVAGVADDGPARLGHGQVGVGLLRLGRRTGRGGSRARRPTRPRPPPAQKFELGPPPGDHARRSPARQGGADQELELAGLVAGQSEAGQVVALDVDRRAAEGVGQADASTSGVGRVASEQSGELGGGCQGGADGHGGLRSDW